MSSKQSAIQEIEPFLTVREAADALHLPYFKLQRAVRAGSIPSYNLLTKRKLVRLSEVIARIEGSRFDRRGEEEQRARR